VDVEYILQKLLNMYKVFHTFKTNSIKLKFEPLTIPVDVERNMISIDEDEEERPPSRMGVVQKMIFQQEIFQVADPEGLRDNMLKLKQFEERLEKSSSKYSTDVLNIMRRLPPITEDEDYPRLYFHKLCELLEKRTFNDIIICPETITSRIIEFTGVSYKIEEDSILSMFRRKLGIDGRFLPTQWKKKIFFLYETKHGVQQFCIIHRIAPAEWVFHNFLYTTRLILHEDKVLKDEIVATKAKLINGLKEFLRTITDWTVKLRPGHEFFPNKLDYHEDHIVTLDTTLNIKKFSRRIIYLVMEKYAMDYNFEFKNPNQKYLDVQYGDIFPEQTKEQEQVSNNSRISSSKSTSVLPKKRMF
jgi:hypothetical protein